MAIFEELEPFQPQRRSKQLRVIDGAGVEVLTVPEAEAALLSVIINDEAGHYASRCLHAKLHIEAFSVPAHRTIAEKIFARASMGHAVDIAVLNDELRRDGTLAAVGGVGFLAEISGLQPTPARFSYFLERVRDVWQARTAKMQADELVESLKADAGGSVAEVLARFALRFQRMADYLLRAARPSMRDLVEARRLRGLKVVAGEIDSSRWIYTGLSWVDATFLPFDVAQEDWLKIGVHAPHGAQRPGRREARRGVPAGDGVSLDRCGGCDALTGQPAQAAGMDA